ncbi:MAG: matrixin family metalloprotease [Nitrososphaerales archaeon]
MVKNWRWKGSLVVVAALLLLIPPVGARPPAADAAVNNLNNAGWASSPTVRIDPTNEPTIDGLPANILIMDAILDFWNDGRSVDFEDENGCGCAFSNFDFGRVYIGEFGAADIVIFFEDLPGGVLGEASWRIDRRTHHITSAIIILTTDVRGLSVENYKNIAAHELGHAIGLTHSGPPRTLMYSYMDINADAYIPLSKSSLNTLERLYSWQSSQIRPPMRIRL